MSASWCFVGVPNVPFRRTLARGSTEFVLANRRRVARVLLQTVVNQLAARHRIAFISVPTAADGSMVSRFTDGVGSTATPHYAWINTLVLVTNPARWTILVFEAVGFDAALPLIERIADISFQTLANGTVLVRDADGISTAEDVLTRISTSVVTSFA